MNQLHQSGLSTTAIITIFAGLAILLGIFITMNGDDTAAPASTQSISGTEAVAQNIAENKAEIAVEAMDDRQEMLDKALEATDQAAAAEDTTDVLMDKDEPTVAASEPASVVESEPVTVAAPGSFSDYSSAKLSDNSTNVLFFHADWCPSCRGLENDLTANAADIPAGVNILKLDYDSETELKSKYGVIRQHTLIVVDGDGNEIKKLTGLTNTLNQVVSQL